MYCSQGSHDVMEKIWLIPTQSESKEAIVSSDFSSLFGCFNVIYTIIIAITSFLDRENISLIKWHQ